MNQICYVITKSIEVNTNMLVFLIKIIRKKFALVIIEGVLTN